MPISVYGTDHKHNSIEERENIYRAVGRSLSKRASFFITCNRIENYGCDIYPPFEYCYDHHGERDVFRHLVRLGCGLRSQLMGERQIMEQLDVFSRLVDKEIGQIIIAALIEARKLRERFSLDSEHTVADAVYRSARGRGLLGKKIIIIGTGRVASMVAERFKGDSPLSFVSGKHKDRARSFAEHYKGEVTNRENIDQAIKGVAMLVSAAASPHYVIRPEHAIEECVLYDLSVPRTIDPSLGAIDLECLGAEFDALNSGMKDRIASAEREIEKRYAS